MEPSIHPQMMPQIQQSAQMPPAMPHLQHQHPHPMMQQQPVQEDQSATQVIAGPDIGRLLQQQPQPLDRKGVLSTTACPKFKWALYAFLAGLVSGIFLYFMMTRRAAMMESMKKVGDTTTKAVENVATVAAADK